MLSLTRWRPFDEVMAIQREADRAFDRFRSDWPSTRERAWLPAVETTSGTQGWVVRMALPGVDPKDVHVEIHGTFLTVSGERSLADSTADRHVSEIGYGPFKRRFALPDNVATDEISATFEHGMLELTLPVAESTKPRRIEIAGTNGEGSEKAA